MHLFAIPRRRGSPQGMGEGGRTLSDDWLFLQYDAHVVMVSEERKYIDLFKGMLQIGVTIN
jgi:hypothetical protein